MSAATPDSAAAAPDSAADSSKRPIDSSPTDPSPPAKIQRLSETDPFPSAEAQGDATNGGGEVAGVRSEEMAGSRNPRAQRYLVAVEYIGTRFSGSQQQPNQRTIVGVLEVRLMVGLLKSVGTGDLTTADVERILNSKTVTAAPPMAPACGLYLANVKYDLSG